MTTQTDGIWVCHCGTSAMFIGAHDDCRAYRESQTFDASSWGIVTVSDYGEFCYDEGHESGYDMGHNELR